MNFQCTFDEDLPNNVFSDEKRLRQILFNLLSNAVKFTERGMVQLQVNRLLIRQEQQSITLRFSVEDQGCGIAEEDLEAIFQPFQQVGEQSRQMEGTGLGLAITRRLVELLGGQLQVRSQLAQGSTFWFDLQLALSETVDHTHTEVSGEQSFMSQVHFLSLCGDKSPLVLLIDTDLERRKTLSDMLQHFALTMVELADLNATEQWLADHVQLPDMVFVYCNDAQCDVLQALRERQQNLVLVVICSQQVAQQLPNRLYDSVCLEPPKADELFHILQSYLQMEWKSTSTEDTAQAVEIVYPEREILEQLLDVVSVGHVSRVMAILKVMREEQPQYRPFAEQVYDFARQFQMDELKAFLLEVLESR